MLMKIDDESNRYLRSLCFHIPTADDKIIKNLENMINLNKLLVLIIQSNVYLMKYICNGNSSLHVA